MPLRESRASREGRQSVVYQYDAGKTTRKGIGADDLIAVIAELKRGYDFRAGLVLIDHERDQQQEQIWAEHPDVGPLVAQLDAARAEGEQIAAEVKASKARDRKSRPGESQSAALTTAWAKVRELRAQVKEAKQAGRALVRDQLRAADTARDKAITAAYTPAVEGGLHWGTVNDLTARHGTAAQQVIKARRAGQRATLTIRDWDETGTLRVQLQRGTFDPPRNPAELAITECEGSGQLVTGPGKGRCRECGKPRALTASGHLKPHRANRAETGLCPGGLGWPSDTECPDCERRTGVDVDGRIVSHWLGGRWKNMIGLAGWRDAEEWEATTPSERKKVKVRFRIGQNQAERIITVPIVYHRPLPDDADITDVRLTRVRVGDVYRVRVSFTCLLPMPEPRLEGGLAVAHTGWRVLEGGALRAAVVTAPAGPPPELVATGAVRWYGTWGEVVIPSSRREYLQMLRDVQGTAHANFHLMRDRLREWITEYPATESVLNPGGMLSNALPQDLTALTRRIARSGRIPGEPRYGDMFESGMKVMVGWTMPDGAELTLDEFYVANQAYGYVYVQLLTWSRQNRHLRQWAAFGRENFSGWRKNLYRNVAAWLTTGTALLILDEWKIPIRRPNLAEGDTVQAQRSRSNLVVVSPGDLRMACRNAAARRGVRCTEAEDVAYGVHNGCGGELPREARGKGLMVECSGNGSGARHMVDQDVNALAALVDAARRGDLAESGKAGGEA
jgi:hypothetical protein